MVEIFQPGGLPGTTAAMETTPKSRSTKWQLAPLAEFQDLAATELKRWESKKLVEKDGKTMEKINENQRFYKKSLMMVQYFREKIWTYWDFSGPLCG